MSIDRAGYGDLSARREFGAFFFGNWQNDPVLECVQCGLEFYGYRNVLHIPMIANRILLDTSGEVLFGFPAEYLRHFRSDAMKLL